MTRNRFVRASRKATTVLCAVVLCGLVGCRKDEPKSEKTPPEAPESYMNDKEFRGELAAERKEVRALIRDRNAIAEKMKSMIEAKRAELKTDDLKAVQAALEKDPAWQALYRDCTNANAKAEAKQNALAKTVRERITPKGKAPIKNISK